MKCWLNGAFVAVADARIDPYDRGFLLGDGVFETILAVDGAVRHLDRHLARLSGAAQLLGIPEPYAHADIASAMARLLQENQLTHGRAALRLTLTRGPGARGVAPPAQARPTVLLTAVSVAAPAASMRAIISSCVRNELSISSRIKSLNYLDNVMARREAAARNADEALMRNSAGALVCASAANLFLVKDGVLRTASVAQGALPGVMRAIVMQAAAARHIDLHEEAIPAAALTGVSEAFLTNALMGVCPLLEIDGRPVGDGMEGPITQWLRLSTSP